MGMGNEVVGSPLHAQKLTVVLEWLGRLACFGGPVLEDVHQADGGVEGLYAGFDERQVGISPEAELIESLGLGSADVAGGGTAGGIGVFVKADQGLPVLVTRALDRFADLLAGEGHVTIL